MGKSDNRNNEVVWRLRNHKGTTILWGSGSAASAVALLLFGGFWVFLLGNTLVSHCFSEVPVNTCEMFRDLRLCCSLTTAIQNIKKRQLSKEMSLQGNNPQTHMTVDL